VLFKAVSIIINKNRKTIKEIKATTSYKINVLLPTKLSKVKQKITIIKSQDAIVNAKNIIKEKVEVIINKVLYTFIDVF
jgi:hypothetical protein